MISNSSIPSFYRELEFPNGYGEQEVEGAEERIQGIPAAFPDIPARNANPKWEHHRGNIPEVWEFVRKEFQGHSLGLGVVLESRAQRRSCPHLHGHGALGTQHSQDPPLPNIPNIPGIPKASSKRGSDPLESPQARLG